MSQTSRPSDAPGQPPGQCRFLNVFCRKLSQCCKLHSALKIGISYPKDTYKSMCTARNAHLMGDSNEDSDVIVGVMTGLSCRLVNAITREESTGNPLKQMLKAIDIPPHQMNETSIDPPIVPNHVLQHANKFHTSTDQEVLLSSQVPIHDLQVIKHSFIWRHDEAWMAGALGPTVLILADCWVLHRHSSSKHLMPEQFAAGVCKSSLNSMNPGQRISKVPKSCGNACSAGTRASRIPSATFGCGAPPGTAATRAATSTGVTPTAAASSRTCPHMSPCSSGSAALSTLQYPLGSSQVYVSGHDCFLYLSGGTSIHLSDCRKMLL